MQALSSTFNYLTGTKSKNFYVHFEGTDTKVKTIKQLSEGAFAYVYLARKSQTNDTFYALKKITKQQKLKVTKREISLWSELNSHPNICRFIDANIENEAMMLTNGLMTGRSQDEFSYVLCEYCDGGSLVNYIMKHDCKLSDQQIVEVMLQVCEGLQHMHGLGIAHRDIKVENILYSTSDNKLTFKLGDFGSATKDHHIDYQQADKRQISKFLDKIEKQCTRMYRAPEMLD